MRSNTINQDSPIQFQQPISNTPVS